MKYCSPGKSVPKNSQALEVSKFFAQRNVMVTEEALSRSLSRLEEYPQSLDASRGGEVFAVETWYCSIPTKNIC